MDLYKEILTSILSRETISVVFPNLTLDVGKFAESEVYKALERIKAIIEDDSLGDTECFMRIEKIVCVLEEIGSSGGNRHDF